MKPKANSKGDPGESKGYDRCQTPPAALAALLPYILPNWVIWEPAAGDGLLSGALATRQRAVLATDLLTGCNFFDCEPAVHWDALITNPPYSIKYKWIGRCYDIGRPFALLMPVEVLGAARAQRDFRRYGMELILFNRRVDFKMPGKGWDSHAQFPVAWFTYKLEIGADITYGHLPKVANPWEIP